MLKNYMEILVDEIVVELSSNLKWCHEEECMDDIKSMALNKLQPKYFLSYEDEAEKKAFLLDKQRRISVMAYVVDAREIICKNCKKKWGNLIVLIFNIIHFYGSIYWYHWIYGIYYLSH